MKPEDQATRILEIEGQRIRLTSYRLNAQYYCTADNIDPGAWIARSEASTREDAEQRAIESARQRLTPRHR